jgi:hypothetical protein
MVKPHARQYSHEAEKYSVIENVACNIIGNVAYGRYRTDAMCS